MLESYLKMKIVRSRFSHVKTSLITSVLPARLPGTFFFQHLFSFSTFLSQSNEEHFNIELNFFFLLFGDNVLVSAEIELIFFLVAGTMICSGFSMRIMLIPE